MKVSTLLTFLGALVLPSAVNAYVPPGADTPAFNLVSSSTTGSLNLLPLRFDPNNGLTTLSGSFPVAVFYFKQGRLTVAPAPGGFSERRPLIDTKQIGVATCATYGAFQFVEGGTTNKCASFNSFYIQSNPENAQLGARLTFNWVGGFYGCGADKAVHYKINPGDGEQGCNPIDLWTVAAS
ncbi:hypothetical protein AX16_009821 [Volvariella volvacea WC 439]|nr:hypothetical protein AX16_009821 [Volvariella volvacea WC 439]